MSILEKLSGESKCSVISSIINPEWEWVKFCDRYFLARVVLRLNGKLRISDRELGIPGARLLFLILSTKRI